jgi:hypothetical protein
MKQCVGPMPITGPVTMGPPQAAPDHAWGRMASGGRLCMEEGVSGALLRLLRLAPVAGAFAASFVASLAAPIGASPKTTCACAIQPHTYNILHDRPSARTKRTDSPSIHMQLHGDE